MTDQISFIFTICLGRKKCDHGDTTSQSKTRASQKSDQSLKWDRFRRPCIAKIITDRVLLLKISFA